MQSCGHSQWLWCWGLQSAVHMVNKARPMLSKVDRWHQQQPWAMTVHTPVVANVWLLSVSAQPRVQHGSCSLRMNMKGHAGSGAAHNHHNQLRRASQLSKYMSCCRAPFLQVWLAMWSTLRRSWCQA